MLATPNMDTIVQIKAPNGDIIDIVNWCDLPIFSSVDLQSGFATEEIDLFQYVEGRAVPGYGTGPVTQRTSTSLDTNMATAGQMTTNEEMLVYAIKPEFYMFTTPTNNNFTTRSIIAEGADGSSPTGMPAPSPEALWVLQQQLLLRLKISESIRAEAGLGYFNTGFGPFQGATITTPAASSFSGTATAGNPTQQAVRSFSLPSHIGAQEKFRVQLVNPQGVACNFGVTEEIDDDERVTRNDVMVTMRVNLEGLYKRPTA